MNNSLISIIIPCYNQAQFLDACLHSVFDQTYSNWECIIVNDGSLDYTEEIGLAWSKKDERFIYSAKENGGLSSARNSGLGLAKGNYIQFLDSDDVLAARKLELSVEQLYVEENRENNIAVTNFRMFTDNLETSSIPYCALDSSLFNFRSVLLNWENVFSIPIHCGLFQIDLFDDFRFPEELKAKEDWIMWLYLFRKGAKVVFIDEPLVYYRVHQKNMTKDSPHMLKNHLKTILYLRKMIPETDYIDYVVFELQQKFEENNTLKTSLNNVKKTASYRVAEKIKGTFVSKYFLNLIKK